MNKDVMINAISAIDQKYIIEYVQYETKLGILKARRQKRIRTLLISAACLALTFCLLVASLPLSLIILGADPVQEWSSPIIDKVIFPLDQQVDIPDDPDDPSSSAQTNLQINWIEWGITEKLFSALGAGTDNSFIDKMQAMSGDGLFGESMHDLGAFLKRLYEYYLKHKKEIDNTMEDSTSGEESTPRQSLAVDGCSYEFNSYWQYYELSMVLVLPEEKMGVLQIPDEVEGYPVGQINRDACRDLKKLTKLIMPDTIKFIGNYAFNSCENLAEIKFSNQLMSIGDCAFSECLALTEIELPDSVNRLGEKAFAYCDGLQSVSLSSSLDSISLRCFAGCDNLVRVDMGESLTTIGESAFSNCDNLESIDFPQTLSKIDRYAFQSSGLKEIMIPYGTSIIGEYAFQECEQLQEVVLPGTLTEIGAGAFADTSIERITMPVILDLKIGAAAFNTVKYVEFGDTVRKWCTWLRRGDELVFAEEAIAKCSDGECFADYVVELPFTYYNNDNYLISGYLATYSLEHENDTCLIIPPYLDDSLYSVVGISYGAFSDHKRLERLYMADTMMILESHALLGCSALRYVKLSNSLKIIEYACFEGCTALQTISIPVSVETIESLVFYDCTKMKAVEYQGTMEQWEQIDVAFNAFRKGVRIICTDGVVFIE